MRKLFKKPWYVRYPLTNVDKVKVAYHKYDICMSELLRDPEFSSLSREEKIELLEWAGEEEYVTVSENGEIEYRKS